MCTARNAGVHKSSLGLSTLGTRGLVNEPCTKTWKCCTEVQSSPPAAPLHPWKWPSRPWSCLHLDFAGPLQGKMSLVLIDPHFKWIEATVTLSTSSIDVIEELRTIFGKLGSPETIVTDNGTGFISLDAYLRRAGIRHVTSAPYHPASNGLAERAVQVVKNSLKKVRTGGVNTRLAKLLFTYRITPQSTTGVSPAELLLGRRLRPRLDLLRPNTPAPVENKQMEQKLRHVRKAKRWFLSVGEPIFARNFGTGCRWFPGDIIERAGPASFRVRLEDGRFNCCHLDQLRHREVEEDTPDTSDIGVDDSKCPLFQLLSLVIMSLHLLLTPSPSVNVPIRVPIDHSQHDQSNIQPNVQPNVQSTDQSNNQPTPRYPRRNRKPRHVYDPGTK